MLHTTDTLVVSNCNWGTCIAPPTRRPRAHHNSQSISWCPYRQNETEMFSDDDETSPAIAVVSAPSVACSMLAVQQQKRLCRQFFAVSAARRGCHTLHAVSAAVMSPVRCVVAENTTDECVKTNNNRFSNIRHLVCVDWEAVLISDCHLQWHIHTSLSTSLQIVRRCHWSSLTSPTGCFTSLDKLFTYVPLSLSSLWTIFYAAVFLFTGGLSVMMYVRVYAFVCRVPLPDKQRKRLGRFQWNLSDSQPPDPCIAQQQPKASKMFNTCHTLTLIELSSKNAENNTFVEFRFRR